MPVKEAPDSLNRQDSNQTDVAIVADRTVLEKVELMRLAVQSAKIGTWARGLNESTVDWDERAEAIFGLAPGTFEGTMQAFLGRVHADDRSKIAEGHRKLIEHGTSYTVEYRAILPDGSIRHIESRASAILGGKTATPRIVGMLMDISERKQLEWEVVERERLLATRDQDARFRAAIETVVDGIITIDTAGQIDTFNPAAERIFGYSAVEVVGHNVKMLMPEPYRTEHDGYLGAYLKTGMAKVIGKDTEATALRKDGATVPIELTVSEMEVGGKRMFTGVVRDITQRKEIDRLKNEFVSTVSHELRTPLTSIRGALGLATSGALGEVPKELGQMLEVAENNTMRLITLVNDLLDLEKLQSSGLEFQMETVSLADIVNGAVEDNRPLADELRVRLQVLNTTGEALIRGDRHRLIQVLANLLSNALKFSFEDGTVEIVLERRENRLRLSVRDHGRGVPEEFKNHLFDRFTQADASDTRSKGGTGLGLNISQQIMKEHGGFIDFEDTGGGGATFYFELPGHAQIGTIDEGQLPQSAKEDQGPRILYVEDDSGITDFVIKLVGGRAKVVVAKTIAEARIMLVQGDFALVILDVELPDGSGLDLLPLEPKKDGTRLPVMIFSVAEVSSGLAKQVDRALVKSRVTNQVLLAEITRLLVLESGEASM